jgi:carboxylesterase
MSATDPPDEARPPAVLPGAEPFSAAGGPVGVLVLHGFTGNPSSVRGLAEACAAAGHAVECPRLPGHGTSVEDLATTSWDDWAAAAEAALARLAGHCDHMVVAGLSMGGALTCWLATRHPELSGIICINPAVAPSDDMTDVVAAMVEAGEQYMDGIGSDVADPDVVESAYDRVALAPLLSMFEVSGRVLPRLGSITCPLLLMTSPQDHVVPPTDSDVLAGAVSGPVERVSLDRSYHVATIDFDRDLVIDRSLGFIASVAG